MGIKGRELMMEKYAWAHIAKEMLQAYAKSLAKANAN
jgi:hypothetical protein